MLVEYQMNRTAPWIASRDAVLYTDAFAKKALPASKEDRFS